MLCNLIGLIYIKELLINMYGMPCQKWIIILFVFIPLLRHVIYPHDWNAETKWYRKKLPFLLSCSSLWRLNSYKKFCWWERKPLPLKTRKEKFLSFISWLNTLEESNTNISKQIYGTECFISCYVSCIVAYWDMLYFLSWPQLLYTAT